MILRRRRSQFALRCPGWHHRPRGPFTMNAFNQHGSWTWEATRLEELVGILSESWMPARGGDHIAIHDADGAYAIGYFTEDGTPYWFGCEAGFAALQAIHRDPLEAILVESVARGHFADLQDPQAEYDTPTPHQGGDHP